MSIGANGIWKEMESLEVAHVILLHPSESCMATIAEGRVKCASFFASAREIMNRTE